MDEASTMNELQTMDLPDTIAIDQVKYSFLISHLVIHAFVYGLARQACLIFGVYVWFRRHTGELVNLLYGYPTDSDVICFCFINPNVHTCI